MKQKCNQGNGLKKQHFINVDQMNRQIKQTKMAQLNEEKSKETWWEKLKKWFKKFFPTNKYTYKNPILDMRK